MNMSDNIAKTVEKMGWSGSNIAIQGFDSGPVTKRNITRKSGLPNFARHVLSKS